MSGCVRIRSAGGAGRTHPHSRPRLGRLRPRTSGFRAAAVTDPPTSHHRWNALSPTDEPFLIDFKTERNAPTPVYGLPQGSQPLVYHE